MTVWVCESTFYGFVSCAPWLYRSTKGQHASYMFPLSVLSRPARLSVHWSQNCFYKCKKRCSIALQPNRLTRLFSYSREVEWRGSLMLPINSPLLVQQHKQRHTGHFPVPFVFLCLANWLPFKQAQAASSLGLQSWSSATLSRSYNRMIIILWHVCHTEMPTTG